MKFLSEPVLFRGGDPGRLLLLDLRMLRRATVLTYAPNLLPTLLEASRVLRWTVRVGVKEALNLIISKAQEFALVT